MDTLLIPNADTIPVAWGWFQLLLLLTFPLHLLAMNAMLGGLILGMIQHFRGGDVRERLAHRIAVVLPLVIACVVNLGVAPYLFVQILYGQFLYTSSILMGVAWIMIIPILIIAYYGAYLYDFQFARLGKAGVGVSLVVSALLLVIAWFFSNNMLLMILPERFSEYFVHMNGTMLVADHPGFLPRYLHIVLGALAIGGLFVAALGRFRADRDFELADHALQYGMQCFVIFTLANILVGSWYLITLPREMMLIFMGGNIGATIAFAVSLLLTAGGVMTAVQKKLWLTIVLAVSLVVLMTFLRAWLRAGYLADIFTLDQLQLVPQYSPMLFFFATLALGLVCLAWLLRKTTEALAQS